MPYNLALFSLTVLVISLIPGLNVMLVVSQSIQGGIRSSRTSIIGIETGNLIYLGISLLGIGVLLIQFPGAMRIIKYSGVAFTVYMAWNLLKAGFGKASLKSTDTPNIGNESKVFLQGMLTIISNPKAFVFWITVLPGFVNSDRDVVFHLFAFGIVAILIDTSVLLTYAYLANAASPFLRKSPKVQFLISGSILLVVAVWLLFS